MNPYEVLGVSETADEETIKKAYRELVKKYHPDKYVNNPLADLAAEKMKQINEAYDMITSGKAKSGGYSGGYSNSSGGYSSGYSNNARSGGYSSGGAASFQAVRMLISSRQLESAEVMLSQLPKTAEWYYLTGVIQLNRGWYDLARQNISRAVQMEPNNIEYKTTFNSMNNRATGYNTYGGGSTMCCGDPCSLCSNLICADCCCECLGGDLISCC